MYIISHDQVRVLVWLPSKCRAIQVFVCLCPALAISTCTKTRCSQSFLIDRPKVLLHWCIRWTDSKHMNSYLGRSELINPLNTSQIYTVCTLLIPLLISVSPRVHHHSVPLYVAQGSLSSPLFRPILCNPLNNMASLKSVCSSYDFSWTFVSHFSTLSDWHFSFWSA